jgi:hypothetical protein
MRDISWWILVAFAEIARLNSNVRTSVTAYYLTLPESPNAKR